MTCHLSWAASRLEERFGVGCKGGRGRKLLENRNRNVGGCVFYLLFYSYFPSGGDIRELSNEKKGRSLEGEASQNGSQVCGRMMFNPVSPKAALCSRS